MFAAWIGDPGPWPAWSPAGISDPGYRDKFLQFRIVFGEGEG